MITKIRATNCYVFSEKVELSLVADMRNKRFTSNVHQENNFNILKTIGIYGSNNVGKTCLLKCINAIQNALLQKENIIRSNLFSGSSICELGITFLEDGREFEYDFIYDTKQRVYLYERFAEIKRDIYGNETKDIYVIRDILDSNHNVTLDSGALSLLTAVSNTGILIHVLNTDSFSKLNEMKNILSSFAEKIDIVDMNNIPLNHTINLMKRKSVLQDRVVEFIKNADVSMDDFQYVNDAEVKIDPSVLINDKPNELVLNIADNLAEQLKLRSVYRGVTVPSVFFDSTGTKKITALASYIVEALANGRIILIDELDSSLHFKLTRAIVAMFNNELNKNAQLIFTVHDINLLDCKMLLRKEQVWFVNKDDKGTYIYSLADFTANQGVRDTTDIIAKYKKGALGDLPEPELINILLSMELDMERSGENE